MQISLINNYLPAITYTRSNISKILADGVWTEHTIVRPPSAIRRRREIHWEQDKSSNPLKIIDDSFTIIFFFLFHFGFDLT